MRKFILAISTLTLLGCSNNQTFLPVNLNQQVAIQAQQPSTWEITDSDFVKLFPKPVKGNKWFYESSHESGSENGGGIGQSWKMSIEITGVQDKKVTATIKYESPYKGKIQKDNVITDTPENFWKTLTTELYSYHSKPLDKIRNYHSCLPPVPREECGLTDIEVPAGTFKTNMIDSSYKAQEYVYPGIIPNPVAIDTLAHNEIDIDPKFGIIQIKGESNFEYDQEAYYVKTNFKLSSFRAGR